MPSMDRVIKAINQYRSGQIDFDEVRGWIVPCAGDLQSEYGYEHHDFRSDLDNWFEYIKYCYKAEDVRELTLSLLAFVEKIIKNEMKPIVLPNEDRVVKDQLLKFGK